MSVPPPCLKRHACILRSVPVPKYILQNESPPSEAAFLDRGVNEVKCSPFQPAFLGSTFRENFSTDPGFTEL